MTPSIPFSSRLLPESADIFSRQPTTVPWRPANQPARPPRRGTLPRVPAEDRASQGLMIGFVVVTIPAVAYSLWQVWQLVGTGELHHAVNAFLP